MGQGYLAVVFGYFRLALIATAVWHIVSTRITSTRQRTLFALVAGVPVAGVATLTTAGNLAIAASFAP